MRPILEAHDVRVTYGNHTVLQVPHLALHRGEVLAVIGPNGSGKSTLLRVLAALQRPDQGRLTFHGQPLNWRDTLAYRRHIAVVLQDPLLLSMDVFANVALGLRLRNLRGREVKARVHAWLERFRVRHLAGQVGYTLSGGEARRVALARAFVLEPDIIFLDEPFAGLDVPTRQEIIPDLRRVLQETGTTALLVTHDRDEALALADRVAVLLDGRIRQVDTADAVFTYPVDEEVAAFVGVTNRVPARVLSREGDGCTVALGDTLHLRARQAPPGDQVLACIRPENMVLSPASSVPAQPGTFLARVHDVISLGSQVEVHLRCGDVHLVAVLGRSQWAMLDSHVGSTVRVDVAPRYVHLLPRSQ